MEIMTLDATDTIQVEQAIFSSSDRGQVKGYQLIAKSAGVDREAAQSLNRWCPSQMPSDNPLDWTINVFRASETLTAVTRTLVGGPEYSGRGAKQIVTSILLLSDGQLRGYDYNSMCVAKTAMTVGRLRLPMLMKHAELPMVKLPACPIVSPDYDGHRCPEQASADRILDEAVDLLEQSRRVVVIGFNNNRWAVERMLPRLSNKTRLSLSFTTGLTPAIRRPYQLQFLPDIDSAGQRTLDAQGITCVFA